MNSNMSICNYYLKDIIAEPHLKTVRFPLIGNQRVEIKHVIPDSHAAKALNYRNPCSGHAGNVKSFLNLIVVIVEVEAGGTQVKLISFIDKPILEANTL